MFSKYLLAYRTINPENERVSILLINIMTKHAHLVSTIICESGQSIVPQDKKVAVFPGITLKKATGNPADRMILEKTHALLTKALKVERGEQRSMENKFIFGGAPNYNTSCHSSIVWEPSREFPGRIPYKVWHEKTCIRSRNPTVLNSHFVSDGLEEAEMINQAVRKMQSNHASFMIPIITKN